MDGGTIRRIEGAATHGAAALFAGALGYSGHTLLTAYGFEPIVALGAAGVGAFAYVPCSRLLAAVDRRAARTLPAFEPRVYEPTEPVDELLLTDPLEPDELLLTERVEAADELVLTDSDRVGAPLVLDDKLAEVDANARVVRLFDRKAMPTPGVADGTSTHAPSDASHELSAALAELRRSLR